nr:early nodulin-16-like [Coffea arabica]
MPTRLLISPAFIILPSLLIQSFGLEYIVGDSFWSIPTTNDFYTNWSSSHFFQTGDTLCFDFDSGLHNVMEMSRREYESCSVDNPFKVFWDGLASVALMEEGFALEIPEDLYHLIKKAIAIRKHLERNRKDKDSKFRLILVERRIHRLARYYKKTKKLLPNWK